MAYPSTVLQIDARISALVAAYPTAVAFDLPNKTWEGGATGSPGRTVRYLRIGTGTGDGRPRVLIVAGMHAREVAPPDAVLNFLEKLLAAYKAGRTMTFKRFIDRRDPANAVTYKTFTIAHPEVVRIVERVELYVVPCVNPDGRAHVMPPSGVTLWRKNRRPAPAGMTCPESPGEFPSPDPAGVDLNRNFDIAWDVNKYYSAAAAPTVDVRDSPCDEDQLYHGPSAASEPETRNIQSLLTGKDIRFYLDVHSYARKFLFAWGMEQNQSNHDEQTFHNPGFDRPAGGRDAAGTSYAEWLPPGAQEKHKELGERMVNAILDSTGYRATDEDADPLAVIARNSSRYATVPATRLRPTQISFNTGTSRDYAFSRSIGKTGSNPVRAVAANPVFSFTFECGHVDDGAFHPHPTKHYPKVEREVGSALAAFLGYAAAWVAPVPPPAPPPTPPPTTGATSGTTTGGSSELCMVVVALAGTPLAEHLPLLASARDRVFGGSVFGRTALSFAVRATRPGAAFLTRHPLVRRLFARLVLAPVIALLRWAGADPLRRRRVVTQA